MMNPTIELNGLEVQLGGRTILHGLTGMLKSRAIGLLGPNGAGKSTLINTLLGFHSPSKGSVRVLGLDSHADGQALRSLVGYMPENDAFIAKMSGVRFVRYMAEISGLPSAQAMERAQEAFVYVGLGEARYRRVGTYSLGMKQRAKLAQAIAHGPKLLILDEPTNGMDPPARKRLIELIREIREASDICLLLSSHLLRDVEETCDEVLILRNGKIASICNLVEERRANRKFLELETIGAEATFTTTLEALGCECPVFAAYIFIANNRTVQSLLPLAPADLFSVEARYFTVIVIVQTQVAFLLNCWVGPVLIAGDLTNGALPLFLSRPFKRSDYVLGKLSVLVLLLSAVTWVPCLLLFCLQAGLGRNRWVWSHLWMIVPIVLCSGIWILMLSLLSLAVSAWVKLRIVATGVIFVTFFVPTGLGEMFNSIMGTHWGRLLNFSDMFRLILAQGFREQSASGILGPMGWNEIPVPAAWGVLILLCLLSLVILNARLRAREAVRG